MRKVIAAINMTIDGFCDHTAVNPGADIHDHYTQLLKSAGVLLYGRVTFQLMEFWPTLLKNPSADKSMNDFAKAIDEVPKIVFSKTLKSVDWNTASIATKSLEAEVEDLKRQPGKDIFVGSPGLIVALTNLKLIDEYQLCVHSVIAGSGMPLFRNMSEKISLNLVNTKVFKDSGAVIHYYTR